MIAKTPNIRCFVAKTHLSQFTYFFRQQMSPFYPFRGGGRWKGTMSPFFTVFFIAGLPKESLILCIKTCKRFQCALFKVWASHDRNYICDSPNIGSLWLESSLSCLNFAMHFLLLLQSKNETWIQTLWEAPRKTSLFCHEDIVTPQCWW